MDDYGSIEYGRKVTSIDGSKSCSSSRYFDMGGSAIATAG